MTSQILIRVDKELKDRFQKLSGIERKSVSQKLRELMEDYVREHSPESTMKSLWDEMGRSLREKGYEASDVERMIQDVRAGKA